MRDNSNDDVRAELWIDTEPHVPNSLVFTYKREDDPGVLEWLRKLMRLNLIVRFDCFDMSDQGEES